MKRRDSWKSTTGVIALIAVLCLPTFTNAGVTGKISGRITDSTTGEPIIGANVILVGSNLGSATDLEGQFAILHITPGLHSIRATTIGYSEVIIQEIRVYIDQTARIDFTMDPVSLEGEVVTVVAERPAVKPDVATSVTSLGGDEVKALPVTNVSDAIELQAGIEDGLVIRGGGAAELLFQVDDVTLRDARNNQPITGVPMSAVQELSIERGGFNAEYGQVRTGVINVVSREGSRDKYEGSFTVKYSPPAPKHFGLSPFDENSMWMRPFLDDEVAWTGTDNGAWDKHTQNQYPDFEGWNAISEQLLSDSDPSNDLSPLGAQKLFLWQHRRTPVTDQPDYSMDAGFGGPVPFIGKYLGDLRFFSSFRSQREMLLIPLSRDDYVDYDWMMVVTSDIQPRMKLRLMTMTGKSHNVAQNFDESGNTSTAYIRTPYQIAAQTSVSQITARIFTPSYYSASDISHQMLALKFNHNISAKTFYEASLEHVERKYLTGPIADRDTSASNMIVDGFYVDEAPFGFSPLPGAGIGNEATDFLYGGHTATTRDSTRTSSTTFKIDLTSQVNFNNLVKTGFELVISDLNLDYGFVKQEFPEGNNYVKMSQRPIRAAAYIQDKFEVREFILNTGLRLDYSNGNTAWPSFIPFSDEWKEFNSASFHPDSVYNETDVESKLSLSPRLAISHPITKNSKLFFNYGHFQQLPTYEEMFRMGRGSQGQMLNLGNPELVLERTVSYELGFDYAVKNSFLVQMAGFYHDITDQQDLTEYVSRDGIALEQANNNSYEDIRGFELTLRKTGGTWWSAFMNYTYQVSTSGRFGKSKQYENPTDQRYYDENTANLYQFKPVPRPYGRASVSLFTPDRFGPGIVGFHPFGGWSTNLLGYWQAGQQLRVSGTYPGARQGAATYLTYRDSYNMVLKLQKSMGLEDRKVTFFVEVNNLLNTKRLSLAGFQDFHDELAYFNSLHLPESRDYQNIVGEDRIGDYRDTDIDFQPIEQVGQLVQGQTIGDPGVIYYAPLVDGNERYEQTYWEYLEEDVGGSWVEVSDSKMDQIIEDKAYIDMPNQTSFNFLNPRQIFFGLQVSF